MTILDCQKRYHDPHVIRHPIDGGYLGQCNGLPKWPYARPKPPRLSEGSARSEYERVHDVYYVSKSLELLWVIGSVNFITCRPTHAEAIQYAQNLVNERRSCVEGS